MGVAYADVYYSAMQVVREGILPKLYEAPDSGEALATEVVLRGAENFKITHTPGATDFRIPLQMAPIGQFGAANYAGGAVNTGGSANIQQLAQTFFPMQLVYTLNYDVIKGYADKELGRFMAWKESLKEGIPLFKRYLDICWHQIGGYQGIIGKSTAYASSVYTMDNINCADLLIEGQGVEIFDSTLATQKTSSVTPNNLPYVSAIDKTNKTVTMANLGSITPAAGDILLMRGCGSTPAFGNGLQYFNDSSTSGTLLGLSRSSYPQVVASQVGNTSTQFSLEEVLLMKHQIKQRRGDVAKLVGLMPQAQESVINLSIVTMSEYMRTEVNEKAIDPLPQMANMQPFAGIPHMTDLHQPRNRVDYVNRTAWGYVYMTNGKPDFYKDGNGNMFFTPYSVSGSTAVPTYSTNWAMICETNWYCVDPGTQGYIMAQVPNGY